MSYVNEYFDFLEQKFHDARETQLENLDKAADMIVKTVQATGNFYVYGTGHSHMIAEELYTRAGGLRFVKAILPPELMLHQMYGKSTNLERLSGYAKAILDLYPVSDKDTFIIISNSGRNSATIEMCTEAQRRGAKVIAITSLKHSNAVEARHTSGKRLFEIADLVIDNQSEYGDAAFMVDGAQGPIGATSTFIGVALVQALTVIITEKLVAAGMPPEATKSANAN